MVNGVMSAHFYFSIDVYRARRGTTRWWCTVTDGKNDVNVTGTSPCLGS